MTERIFQIILEYGIWDSRTRLYQLSCQIILTHRIPELVREAMRAGERGKTTEEQS